MHWSVINCQLRKDSVEILRDRRTILAMTLVPVVIVPLVILLLGAMAQEGVKRLQSGAAEVAILGLEHAPKEIRGFLSAMQTDEHLNNYLTLGEAHKDPFTRGVCIASSKAPEADYLVATPYRLSDLCQQQHFLSPKLELSWLTSVQVSNIPELLDYYSSELIEKILLGEQQSFAELQPVVTLARIVEEQIKLGEFSALVVLHPGFAAALAEDAGVGFYTVLYADSEERSRSARRQVNSFFAHGARGVAFARLQDKELDPEVMLPVSQEGVNISPPFNILSRILPYFMVLTCFIGCLYPALDVIAGEKERGTLETLLLAPVSRIDLLAGKFLLVSLCGLLSGVLCLLSLSFVLEQVPAIREMSQSSISLVWRIAFSILLLIPLSWLFASLLLLVSGLANNYRQAQSYSMPLNLAIIIPAFFSILPGFELDAVFSVTPVVNISLALRDYWNGELEFLWLWLVLPSTMMCCVLLLIISANRLCRPEFGLRAGDLS